MNISNKWDKQEKTYSLNPNFVRENISPKFGLRIDTKQKDLFFDIMQFFSRLSHQKEHLGEYRKTQNHPPREFHNNCEIEKKKPMT